MKQLFETEEEAITWIYKNMALAIKPQHEDKTTLVYPFIHAYAHKQVVEHLAKQLFKHQQEKLKQNNNEQN